ncbi:hypothetical protein StoSoilA2_20420 [Arthrobacter sp. StoSoilA2]|nr:hypothetical protein StoSoilA2_20420 [Arthrobacter sp. StoSoilA2]
MRLQPRKGASRKYSQSPVKVAAALVAFSGMLAVTGCSGPTNAASSNGDDDTIRIGVSAVLTTLDPGQNFSIGQVAITNLFGGTLTNLNSDGKAVSMGLAESVTPGDEQYVVKLRAGLKFSDGSPLTAADVAASFGHYLADKTNGYDYTYAPIEKVTAIDDLTVAFDLNYPYPALEYALSLPGSIIVPAKDIEERGADLYRGDPLPSSGRYKIQTSNQDQIILEANPNYPAQQPETKTLIFQKVADPVSRLAQVQSGQLDYAEEIAPKQLAQLSGPVEARTAFAANGQTFLAMNNRDNSILSDPRIRKAVSTAIDREQINQIVFADRNRLGLGLFASSSPHNRPFLQEKANVAAAKSLLAGTKCENSCSLRFTNAGDADIAVVVQQNLKAVGIEVSIENVEPAVLSKNADEGNYDLLATGNFEQGDYPAISLQFTLGPTIQALRTGYNNPEMTQLLEKLKTASGSEADSTLDQVKTLFEEDLPLAPIADYMVNSASRIPSERFGLDSTLFYHVR